MLPAASWPFAAWVTLGAVTQVLATAFFVAVPELSRCAEYGAMRVKGGALPHPDLPRF